MARSLGAMASMSSATASVLDGDAEIAAAAQRRLSRICPVKRSEGVPFIPGDIPRPEIHGRAQRVHNALQLFLPPVDIGFVIILKPQPAAGAMPGSAPFGRWQSRSV